MQKFTEGVRTSVHLRTLEMSRICGMKGRRSSCKHCPPVRQHLAGHGLTILTLQCRHSGIEQFHITSWEIDGEPAENFNFWGSKITADGDCSHEIKRRLLFGRKVMTNLDSILKSRDITLPTKVRLVKAMVFPVVVYGCESWTVKKAECQKIDAFEL